jgi:pimeloyl-ACP methyl ester carboxylesterase
MAMELQTWEQVDWRQHQRWVSVRGGPVNVIELGSGPPVVFVHGLGGSWQNWLHQLPAFAEHHRVVAFDLPGFGYSPLPSVQVSIQGFVTATGELLDALDIDTVALVGNSMGGLISCELALAEPARVARLGLISPAGVALRNRQQRISLLRSLFPAVALTGHWISANAEPAARRRRLRNRLLAFVSSRPDAIPAAFAAEQLRGMGKPGLWPAMEGVIMHSVEDRLPGISAPTLLVWGQDDPVLPVRHADVFAAAISHARKVTFADTGHCAMFERSAEFNTLLSELLGDPAPAAVAATVASG